MTTPKASLTPVSDLTKVSNLDASLTVQEQVLWFEVTVHDHVAVAVGHPGDDLLEEAACLLLLQLKVENARGITGQLENKAHHDKPRCTHRPAVSSSS